MCDFDVTSSCDVISPDHFVRGFYNSSFRRCRPNFLVLQKEYKILVHILSTYKKLEQSTHWIIQKKWCKDFTFGSDCTVSPNQPVYIDVVVVVVVVDFIYSRWSNRQSLLKGTYWRKKKRRKGQKIEIWEGRINWLNHYGMNYNTELEKLYTAINVANCKRNELRINKKKIEERLFESWLWKCW